MSSSSSLAEGGSGHSFPLGPAPVNAARGASFLWRRTQVSPFRRLPASQSLGLLSPPSLLPFPTRSVCLSVVQAPHVLLGPRGPDVPPPPPPARGRGVAGWAAPPFPALSSPAFQAQPWLGPGGGEHGCPTLGLPGSEEWELGREEGKWERSGGGRAAVLRYVQVFTRELLPVLPAALGSLSPRLQGQGV